MRSSPTGATGQTRNGITMGDAYFYHLTRSPLDQALRLLLDRAIARGWRVGVRGLTAERLDWLDEKLWLGPDDGFLPHARAGGDRDAEQPVLLTTESHLPNRAACLMTIEGAEVTVEEAAAFERVCVLFDGDDGPGLTRARDQWRALTRAGIAAQYWSEESGRWHMKAQSGAKGAT
jgi:DNA polymerase-3 subunit chi